jgi:hypothetical protein
VSDHEAVDAAPVAFFLPRIGDAMMLNHETRSDYEKEGSMRATEGRRCQAKRTIRSHQGFVSADTRGTITGEIENLGRRLIAVRWDNGLSIYVFSEEIAIDADPDFCGVR